MVPITPSWRDIRRAIEIVQVDSMRVVGRVVANGTQVYAVPSRSQPGMVHLTYIDPATRRIVCDCPGYQHRGVCAHAMVATRAVIDEAQTVIDAMLDSAAGAMAEDQAS
jgi:hypothetical protein